MPLFNFTDAENEHPKLNGIIWTQNFLKGQGFQVNNNIVFQDNQSAMLLEQNGRMSSSWRIHHLDIRYFFVTDQVNKKCLRVEYCPTNDMKLISSQSLCRAANFEHFAT
jgi:hypothetical protein